MARSPIDYFRPLFAPGTVAVVGASSRKEILGNTFLRRIRELGFDGEIYPIHPTAKEIDGLTAWPSLGETPRPVDYCFVAVPAPQVAEVIRSAGGRMRFVQVVSAGFGETEDGIGLQDGLVAAARESACRVLGPNCLGLYSPRGGITFVEGAPATGGSVGVVSQSGGLGTDIVTRGCRRGIAYSAVVTVGNCADLGPTDFVEYFLEDPHTQVIGAYVEQVLDGRRLFDVLRRGAARKPVVILKGGRTGQGARAAASHTGAMAADDRVWTALSRQTGSVLVDTLEEFLDVLLAFQHLHARIERPTERTVLFGNGGGTGVLACDLFSRRGLELPALDTATVDALRRLELPPGTSIDNPIDAPVATLRQEDGAIAERIIDAILEHSAPDALVMHLNMASFRGRTPPSVMQNLLDAALRALGRHPQRPHFLLVLRSEGDPETESLRSSFRSTALEAGVPVFDELANAASALVGLRTVERFRHARQLPATHPRPD